MTEIVERISAATGRPCRYVDVTFEEKRRRYTAAGVPPHVMDLFDEQFMERRRTPEARVELVAHHTFGVTPTSFADFARAHSTEFAGQARGERPLPRSCAAADLRRLVRRHPGHAGGRPHRYWSSLSSVTSSILAQVAWLPAAHAPA